MHTLSQGQALLELDDMCMVPLHTPHAHTYASEGHTCTMYTQATVRKECTVQLLSECALKSNVNWFRDGFPNVPHGSPWL